MEIRRGAKKLYMLTRFGEGPEAFFYIRGKKSNGT